MPLINVHLVAGRTDEQKRALLQALTDAAVASIGAPIESVRVWITEVAPTDFMSAGQLISERPSASS